MLKSTDRTRRDFGASIIPPRACGPVTKNLMASSYQGASNPGGYVGLQPAFAQKVSGNRVAVELALTQPEQQPAQQQLLPNQMRKLTVRLLVDTLVLRVNNSPGDASTLLKRPGTAQGTIPLL